MSGTREELKETSNEKTPLVVIFGSDYNHNASLFNMMTGTSTVPAMQFHPKQKGTPLEYKISRNSVSEKVTLLNTPELTEKSTRSLNKLFAGVATSYTLSAFIFVKPNRRVMTDHEETYTLARQAADQLHIPLIMGLSSNIPNDNVEKWCAEDKEYYETRYQWRFDAIVPIYNFCDELISTFKDSPQAAQDRLKNLRDKSCGLMASTLEQHALLGSQAVPIPVDQHIFSTTTSTALVNNGVFKLASNHRKEEPKASNCIYICAG